MYQRALDTKRLPVVGRKCFVARLRAAQAKQGMREVVEELVVDEAVEEKSVAAVADNTDNCSV